MQHATNNGSHASEEPQGEALHRSDDASVEETGTNHTGSENEHVDIHEELIEIGNLIYEYQGMDWWRVTDTKRNYSYRTKGTREELLVKAKKMHAHEKRKEKIFGKNSAGKSTDSHWYKLKVRQLEKTEGVE